jgi:hypothetical protein
MALVGDGGRDYVKTITLLKGFPFVPPFIAISHIYMQTTQVHIV